MRFFFPWCFHCVPGVFNTSCSRGAGGVQRLCALKPCQGALCCARGLCAMPPRHTRGLHTVSGVSVPYQKSWCHARGLHAAPGVSMSYQRFLCRTRALRSITEISVPYQGLQVISPQLGAWGPSLLVAPSWLLALWEEQLWLTASKGWTHCTAANSN